MLDAGFVRDHIDDVRTGLRNRGLQPDAELEQIATLETRRRRLIPEMEGLKREQNAAGDEIARAKRQGKDASDIFAANKARALQIRQLEVQVDQVEQQRASLLMTIPNLPHASVPVGTSAEDNQEVRHYGEPKSFDFEPRPHWDLGPALGIIDFERATKMSGSRFSVLMGAGARLARALINFMLDLHAREHGYLEVEPPFLVNADALRGTGNLPKFEQDLFKIAGEWDLYLIPTAEVPLTNLHRGEILDGRLLPLRYTASTPCFRSEAGSYGADVRGLIRQHQFDKVELVRFCRGAESPAEHEKMTGHAEEVLRRLELPYRVVLLAAGDLGFAGAKTYDLEVWAPGVGQWLEVSSSSTFTDYQARRANIRCRPRPGEKPEFVHTLNASGVALPRTLAALLETRQQPDGSVTLPPALTPYFGADRFGGG